IGVTALEVHRLVHVAGLSPLDHVEHPELVRKEWLLEPLATEGLEVGNLRPTLGLLFLAGSADVIYGRLESFVRLPPGAVGLFGATHHRHSFSNLQALGDELKYLRLGLCDRDGLLARTSGKVRGHWCLSLLLAVAVATGM